MKLSASKTTGLEKPLSGKKTYSTPTLIIYGSVRDATNDMIGLIGDGALQRS